MGFSFRDSFQILNISFKNYSLQDIPVAAQDEMQLKIQGFTVHIVCRKFIMYKQI